MHSVVVNLYIDMGRASASLQMEWLGLCTAEKLGDAATVIVMRRMSVVGPFVGGLPGEMAAPVYVCYGNSCRQLESASIMSKPDYR